VRGAREKKHFTHKMELWPTPSNRYLYKGSSSNNTSTTNKTNNLNIDLLIIKGNSNSFLGWGIGHDGRRNHNLGIN
jgi:hypothetical protein